MNSICLKLSQRAMIIRKNIHIKMAFFMIIFSLAIAGCASRVKQPDFNLEMDGFREYRWGADIEHIGNGLINEGFDEQRNVEWFRKKDDSLTIGKADLESINYIFRDGRFTAVSIIAHGEKNYFELREELIKGLGKTQIENGPNFTWDLHNTSILFSYNDMSETSMLIIRTKGD